MQGDIPRNTGLGREIYYKDTGGYTRGYRGIYHGIQG